MGQNRAAAFATNSKRCPTRQAPGPENKKAWDGKSQALSRLTI
jgi:hypothetical protein